MSALQGTGREQESKMKCGQRCRAYPIPEPPHSPRRAGLTAAFPPASSRNPPACITGCQDESVLRGWPPLRSCDKLPPRTAKCGIDLESVRNRSHSNCLNRSLRLTLPCTPRRWSQTHPHRRLSPKRCPSPCAESPSHSTFV